MALHAMFLTAFFPMCGEPQVLQDPLVRGAGGLANVQDLEILLLAQVTLDLVTNPFAGAPDSLAMVPEAYWAVRPRKSPRQAEPRVLLHQDVLDGCAGALYVSDPRGPHDLGHLIVMFL